MLYREWSEALPLAEAALADADVGLVTFYDLDTPVTLDHLRAR